MGAFGKMPADQLFRPFELKGRVGEPVCLDPSLPTRATENKPDWTGIVVLNWTGSVAGTGPIVRRYGVQISW